MFEDEIADAPKQLAAFARSHASPRARFKSPPSSGDGAVDIFLLAVRDAGNDRGVGWVENIESFPRSGRHPFAADKVLFRSGEPGSDASADAGRSFGSAMPIAAVAGAAAAVGFGRTDRTLTGGDSFHNREIWTVMFLLRSIKTNLVLDMRNANPNHVLRSFKLQAPSSREAPKIKHPMLVLVGVLVLVIGLEPAAEKTKNDYEEEDE